MPRNELLISTADLAEALGYSGKCAWERALRFMKRHKIAIRVGSHWFTTRDRLHEAAHGPGASSMSAKTCDEIFGALDSLPPRTWPASKGAAG